jgi:outer membrane protein assembly factor BamB
MTDCLLRRIGRCLALVGCCFLLLVACDNRPPNHPPVITSFSVTPSSGAAPLQVTFHWLVSDADHDDLKIRVLSPYFNQQVNGEPSAELQHAFVLYPPFPKQFEVRLIVEDLVRGYCGVWGCIPDVFKGGHAEESLQMEVTAPTGKLKWQVQLGNLDSELPTSPALAPDGTVYLIAEDGSLLSLYAINPNGSQKWHYPNLRPSWSLFPAIAADGSIYVLSGDNSLKAISPLGQFRWSVPKVRTAPAIASDGTLYVGSSQPYLSAIDPTGVVKWQYATEGLVMSDPVIASDGTVYADSSDGFLYALNPNGTLKWRKQISWKPFALGADGTIHNCIGALNPQGEVKWGFPNDYPCLPVLSSDGGIYIVDILGTPRVGVYQASDGTPRWVFLATGTTSGAVPAVGANGVCYIGFTDKYLYALNPDGMVKQGYLLQGPPSSAVIAPDGTIYVWAGGYLDALESDSLGLDSSSWPRFRHDNQNTGRLP